VFLFLFLFSVFVSSGSVQMVESQRCKWSLEREKSFTEIFRKEELDRLPCIVSFVKTNNPFNHEEVTYTRRDAGYLEKWVYILYSVQQKKNKQSKQLQNH